MILIMKSHLCNHVKAYFCLFDYITEIQILNKKMHEDKILMSRYIHNK